MRQRKLLTVILSYVSVFVAMALVFSGVYFVRPFSPVNQPLLIDKVTTPKGAAVYLTQTYRGFPDLYDVHFYTNDTNGVWRQYYIEHEDTFWASGNLRVDTQKKAVSVYKGSRPMAHFDWSNNSYRLERDKPAKAKSDFRLLQESTKPPMFARK